ncbi:MAG: SRPBCC family protein [Myxococcota bacterium]
MSAAPLAIDPDIRTAVPPPPAFYDGPAWWQAVRDRVLVPSWHACEPAPRGPAQVVPETCLPGTLDEPILRTVDAVGRAHVLANVCTACGAVLTERERADAVELRCEDRDCGTRYGLDGGVVSGPTLHVTPSHTWGPITFASVSPAVSGAAWLEPVRHRLASTPLAAAMHQPRGSRDFAVRAHWMRYCEHALRASLADDLGAFDLLSTGVVREAAGSDGPATRVWLFPTTIVDIDAHGISVRAVQPASPRSTRVVLHRYAWAQGGPGEVDRRHYEDEARIERRARGLRSHAMRAHRYDPSRDVGVHHFHRLLAHHLA